MNFIDLSVQEDGETPSAPPARSSANKADQTVVGAQKEISVDSCGSLNKHGPNAPNSMLPRANQVESAGARISDLPSRFESLNFLDLHIYYDDYGSHSK